MLRESILWRHSKRSHFSGEKETEKERTSCSSEVSAKLLAIEVSVDTLCKQRSLGL